MTRLCGLHDIEDPGSKGFQTSKGHVFVVRKDNNVFVYRNACPHLGVNLEWQEDRFLDSENRLIQCATHGALFLIETGECIAGPCPGDRLIKVAYEVRDNAVHLV